VDGKLLVDVSTDPKRGDSFFNTGTTEERAVLKGLKAGQEYKLEARLSNADFAGKIVQFPSWGGIRIGGVSKVEGKQAIADAVKLAGESDGK
jgi:beta-glucosidase